MSNPCSICGTTPALLIDAKEKATYWMCADCMFETIQDKWKIEEENAALKRVARAAKVLLWRDPSKLKYFEKIDELDDALKEADALMGADRRGCGLSAFLEDGDG